MTRLRKLISFGQISILMKFSMPVYLARRMKFKPPCSYRSCRAVKRKTGKVAARVIDSKDVTATRGNLGAMAPSLASCRVYRDERIETEKYSFKYCEDKQDVY